MPSDTLLVGDANIRVMSPPGGVAAMPNALAVASETTVWTPASGKKFRLTGMDIAGSVAGVYTFRDNTAGTVIYRTYLAANTPRSIVLPGSGLLSGAADRPLTCLGPAASTISGALFGYEE